MKIYINTDNETYGLPRFFVEILTRMGLRTNTPECVVNISSIHTKGIKQGTKCTVYLEGDDFLIKGTNTKYYDTADLLYIGSPNYLSLYPKKTKIIKCGVDVDWHYPRNVKKKYDYVFVGKVRGDSVYDNRMAVLEELKKSKYKILITNGTQETYPDLMSSGRIILNVLPRRGDDVCVNQRVFEGMAMGCLMTDYDKALDDFGFVKNVHYLPLDRFGDISDEEIAWVHETGSEYVKKHYTYQGAIHTLIRDIEEFTGEKIC